MTPLDKMSAALALSQSGEDCFEALLPEAQDALRENVRAVLASAWQPIGTAPKDGTIIWAYGTIGGSYGYTEDRKDMVKARWFRAPSSPPGGLWSVAQPTARYDSGFAPTHWMPLPAAPDTALTDQS